jgi:hypothetical protein
VESRDTDLYLAAAEGLARAGDRMGYELLVELLGCATTACGDPDPARRALVELTGQDFGPREIEVEKSRESWEAYRQSLRAWRAWWQANRQRFGREFHD